MTGLTVSGTVRDKTGNVAAWSAATDVSDTGPFYTLASDSLSNWTRENGQASNTYSYDKSSNVTMAGGVMSIRGARETAPNGAEFTSGDALGRHVTVPNYFTAEVSARLPYGQGIWPCPLWFRPLNGSDGEIDVMEQFGTVPYQKVTLHNAYGTGHKMVSATKRWDALPNPSQTAEHLWRIVKAPNSVKVWCDSILIADLAPEDAPAGFDWATILENPARTWYPRITLQLGNDGAVGLPSASFTTCLLQVTSLRIWA